MEHTGRRTRTAFAAVPVIATLGAADQRALWQRCVVRTFRAGECLRLQGDPADHLLLLLSGRVRATQVSAGGHVVRSESLTAPCALDKIAVIDGRGHSATLAAVDDCVVAAVPRQPFLAAAAALPESSAHVFRALAAEARAHQADLDLRSVPGGRRRVAGWLLREAARTAGTVRLPGSQSDLARLLGVSRVTVNRALRALEQAGMVRSTAAGLEIVDETGLSALLVD